MDDLERKALIFAERAHRGQVRRYTGDPYIVHPVAVAHIVKSVPHTVEMAAAALLHDVIEDSDVTIDEIEAAFGPPITTLVAWLTNVSTPADGNRAARKNLDHHRLMQAPAEAQTIKFADIIDNAKSISAHDPDFWRTYRRECLSLSRLMTRGDASLRAQALRLLAE
jgi:(p)ppGpp synthase/HD superfamily hydrolase